MAAPFVMAQYDQLESLADRFSRQAEVSDDLLGGVRSAFRPLESGSWRGDAFDAFDAEMRDELVPAVRRLIELLGACGATVRQIAAILRQAEEDAAACFKDWAIQGDAQGGGTPNGAGATPGDIASRLKSLVDDAVSMYRQHKDAIKMGGRLLSGAMGLINGARIFLGLTGTAGATYANQLRLAGTHAIKQLAGLSKNLTHLAYASGSVASRLSFLHRMAGSHAIESLVGKGGKGFLGNAMGRFPLIMNAMTAVGTGFDNWQTYQGQDHAILKTATGTTVDMAVKMGFKAGGTYAGAVLFGGLGSLAGPVGAAVGAKIGGALGGIAGDYLGEKFMQTDLYKQGKSAIVNAVADGADIVGEKISGGLRSLGNAVGKLDLNPFN